MADAPLPRFLTVKEAATRLGMTTQGVRKAVRERRLDGSTRVLSNGKREYAVSREAVEAFHAGRSTTLETRVDTLSIQLELSERAGHEKDLKIVALESQLEVAIRDLERARHAIRALIGEYETQGKAARGVG